MYKLEIIQQLKSLLANAKYQAAYNPDEDIFRRDAEALEVAIAALRPVSRERVEQVWRGCKACKGAYFATGTLRFVSPVDADHELVTTANGTFAFCANCGRPMMDEAVQMVMERLEALNENRD